MIHHVSTEIDHLVILKLLALFPLPLYISKVLRQQQQSDFVDSFHLKIDLSQE